MGELQKGHGMAVIPAQLVVSTPVRELTQAHFSGVNTARVGGGRNLNGSFLGLRPSTTGLLDGQAASVST